MLIYVRTGNVAVYDYLRLLLPAPRDDSGCAERAAGGGHKEMIERLIADGQHLTYKAATGAVEHSLDMLSYVYAKGMQMTH